MFLIFNKEKITTYLVVLCTVIILFSMVFNTGRSNVISVSSNVEIKNTNNLITKCNSIESEYEY